ncbi:MAG: PadR family transcriptional regulator [Clostridiales bacterium]|nr:PadR family transcriptional regulator [Clostridiales bacterium]MDY4171382.1 helix-turn-helix transcriptional regulator [Evtepia sp.]
MERKKTLEHTSLLVLSLLKGQDLYGYQMITELERRSDHTFQMKEGTLYPVLKKLENGGHVTAYEAEVSGRTRKYYHITKKGLKQLAQETADWEEYAHGVNSVLGFITG